MSLHTHSTDFPSIARFWTLKEVHKLSQLPQQDYSACEFLGGIYIFAGCIGGVLRNDLHVIDSQSFSSEIAITTGEIPCPRAGHTAINVGGHLLGGIAVFGGETSNSRWDDSLYSLDIGSKTWTKLPMQSNSLVGRRDHSAVMIESTMYLFGGQVDGYYFNDLVAFDSKTLSTQCPRWDYISPGYENPPERACHSAVVYENRIYIFGGKDSEHYFDDLWCYDPKMYTWSQIAGNGGPSKRAGHTACAHNHFMYVFGGHGESERFLNEAYVFNFLDGVWSDLATVQLGTGSITACLIQEKIHVINDQCNSINILDTGKAGKYMQPCSGDSSSSNIQDRSRSPDLLSTDAIGQQSTLACQAQSCRDQSTSDLDFNRLLTPSPVHYEPNPTKDSSGQISGNVSYINRAHSPSQLQAPSNFILDNGNTSDTITSLDQSAPAQQLNGSTSSIKSYTSTQLSSPSPSNTGLLGSTDRSHLSGSTAQTENIATAVNLKESKVSPRQFATFIPLSPEKVDYQRSAEPEMLRVQISRQSPPVENFPSLIDTPRRYAGSARVAEKQTPTMSPELNPSSLIRCSSALDSYPDEKTHHLPDFNAPEKPSISQITEKFGHHIKHPSSLPKIHHEKATSIFEERLSKELDFDDDQEDYIKSTDEELKNSAAIEAPLKPKTEIQRIHTELTDYRVNSKLDLWNSVQKAVSGKTEYLVKESTALHNLNFLQKDEVDPEKIKLLQALLLLKDQLSKAQAKLTQNCEYAAQRIADGEKHRQVALQETAYLRMKISAINSSSTENLCKIEQDRIVELEKRLAKALAENQSLRSKIDLQAQEAAKDRENRLLFDESSRNNLNRAIEAENSCRVIKEKFTSLQDALKKSQQAVLEGNNRASKAEAILYAKETEATVILERLASLEESSAQERQARELASNVVNAANERANEAERMWLDAQQEIQALEKESIELRKTIEQKSEELARTHFQASEMETLWLATKQQLESLGSISQVFHNSKHPSEDGVEEKLTRANYRIAELEAELNLLREVKEGSRDVIEKLESDNISLAQKVESLEKKHHNAQSDLSELRLRLADAQDNIYEMKLQLMNSQDLLRAESLELEGARLKITTLANMMQELSCTGGLDSHRIVALASDKLDHDLKSRQHSLEDNTKLSQQLESVQDRLNQTKLHNKELQEKYKTTLQELHDIVEKQQPLLDSEKAAKAKVAAAEHEIAKLKDQFLAMQVKANSLEDLLRQSRPKPTSLNADLEISIQANQEKIQELEKLLKESEKKSTRMEKDTQRAIKYVRDSESMLRKMKAELQRSQTQVIELTKQLRARQMI